MDNLGAPKTENGCASSSRGPRRSAGVVLGGLLVAGPQPDRGGVLEGESAAEEGGGSDEGGDAPRGGDRRGLGGRDVRGGARLVCPLRLRAVGSTLMSTAVV